MLGKGDPPSGAWYAGQLAEAKQRALAQTNYNQYAELYKYGLANAFGQPKPVDYQPKPAPEPAPKLEEPGDPTEARFKGLIKDLD